MTTVAIEIGGVDLTSRVLFSTARFMSQVNGSPGDFYCRLRDHDRTLSLVTGSDVLLKIDGAAAWRGFLQQAQRVYVFPAINVDAFGETRFMDIIGADINVLFNKRIVFNQASPTTVAGKLYPPFQADNAVIADLVADYLDLSSDTIDTSTFVENVGDITEDQEGRAWSAGDTWGQAMQSIAMLPAAVFYLKPTLAGADLVYTDVDTPNAPYAMSDVPGPGIVGYREMEISKDGTGLVNDQLAWGMGYGSPVPVFVRDQDAASIALHGRWQAGTVRPGIYKQATINRVAASIVDGSPTSHRGAKDDKVSAIVSTYQPGFLPGQKIDFTSTVWDFNDVIPIRKMEITFESPTDPKFRLTLSHEIDAPWGFIDQYLPSFAFPPFPPLPPLPGFTLPEGCSDTICGITDSFDRANTTSPDWGTSDSGLLWSTQANTAPDAIIDIDGNRGHIWCNSGTGTASRNGIADLALRPARYRLDFYMAQWGSALGNLSSETFSVGNWGFGYSIRRVRSSGGVLTAELRLTASFPSFAVETISFDVTQGVQYHILWEIEEDVEQRIKVYTGAEPGAWTLTQSIVGKVWASSGTFRVSLANGGSSSLLSSWGESEIYVDNFSLEDANGVAINRCTEYRFDNFDRTVSGGWGTSSDGYVWTGAQAGLSVASNHGLMSGTTSLDVSVDDVASGVLWGAQVWEMLALVKIDVVPATGLVDLSFTVEGANTAPRDLVLEFAVSGGQIALDGFSDTAAMTWAADGYYYVRWSFDWLGLSRAKVWQVTDAEPVAWMVETNFPESLPTHPISFLVSFFNSSTSKTITFESIDFDYAGKPCYDSGPPPSEGSMSIDPSGYGCETPTLTGSGVYQLTSSINAGTSRVYVNGFLQRPGGLLEYVEDPPNGQIIFNGAEIPDPASDVLVCYIPGAPL